MVKRHTHTRKPEPVTAWQHEPGAKLPQWARKAGIKPGDIAGEEPAVPFGHWLVHNARRAMVMVMSPEQFAAEYEEAAAK
jgi:hypothetical protein